MTKTQMIDKIAKSTTLTKKQATEAVDAMVAAMQDALVAGDSVQIFGFGGFQFSGIDSVVTIITGEYLHISLSEVQRWLFIVLPLVLAVSLVVLSRKHHVFIGAMTYMITIAVGAYIVFFIFFNWIMN